MSRKLGLLLLVPILDYLRNRLAYDRYFRARTLMGRLFLKNYHVGYVQYKYTVHYVVLSYSYYLWNICTVGRVVALRVTAIYPYLYCTSTEYVSIAKPSGTSNNFSSHEVVQVRARTQLLYVKRS